MCKREDKKKMVKIANRPLIKNNPTIARRATNTNNFYANKNKIDLFDFLKKTGKDFPTVDDHGNMVVDINDSNKRRWLEE